MKKQTITKELNSQLGDLLRLHHVTVSQPHERILQLDDVPVGDSFNQPVTNLLVRQDSRRDRWQVFVDETLKYLGTDLARQQLFQGSQHRGWLLLSQRFAAGDVNDAIVWALNMLDSGLRSVAPEELRDRFESTDQEGEGLSDASASSDLLDGLDQRVAKLLKPAALELSPVIPTSSQADAIALTAETVMRSVAPNMPLLMGRSGVGKTTVARFAANELIQRGLVSKVVEVSAGAICAGQIFVPERDERLRATIDAVASVTGVVCIVEQIDLILARSSAAASIIADALDIGARFIGVARPEFNPSRLRRSSQLLRRIQPCVLQEPDFAETAEILRRRCANHDLSGDTELAPSVLPMVNRYSTQRPGSNPAAAIGLLEAVLNRAAFSGQRCVGPDDILHLMHQSENQ